MALSHDGQCSYEKMNCFSHDNDHWRTAPFWKDGIFHFSSSITRFRPFDPISTCLGTILPLIQWWIHPVLYCCNVQAIPVQFFSISFNSSAPFYSCWTRIWFDCYILWDFHPIWSGRWVVSFIRPRFWHVSCWIWTEFSLFELILFGCHVIKQSMKDSIRFSCCLLLEWCF